MQRRKLNSFFLIQLDTVVRETPTVRVRPRRLLRSRSGVQNLLTPRFWIGMGSRILATLATATMAAIELFAIRCMTIADESIALAVGTVKGDRHHEDSSFLNCLTFRVSHILPRCTTTAICTGL